MGLHANCTRLENFKIGNLLILKDLIYIQILAQSLH